MKKTLKIILIVLCVLLAILIIIKLTTSKNEELTPEEKAKVYATLNEYNSKQEREKEIEKEADDLLSEYAGSLSDDIIFLKNTNAFTFYSLICNTLNTEINSTSYVGLIELYTSSNSLYSFDVCSNANKEICFIELNVNKSNYSKDYFKILTKLNYNGCNSNLLSNWIDNNIGKESKTKIGDLNFEFKLTNTGLPYLNAYTNGYKANEIKLLS